MLFKIESTSGNIKELSSEDVFANFVEMIYQSTRIPNISDEELENYKKCSLELLSELFDRQEFDLLNNLIDFP